MTITYTIADRDYTLCPKDEALTEPCLFDLSYLTLIRVKGEHAADFLQGQLSCDVRLVNAQEKRQGALCNLQGRIMMLTELIYWQDYCLIVPRDLADSTMKWLSKPAMLSRVKLEVDSDVVILGLYDKSHTQTLTESSDYCCSLGNGFYFILTTNNKYTDLHGSLAWHRLRLLNKQIEIYPQSTGLFLPHRLGLHETECISFNKGCYKGQEIIARTQYRAKLKHHLALFTIQTKEPLQIGQHLLSTDQHRVELGELVDFAPLKNDQFLIALSILIEHPDEGIFDGHQHAIRFEFASP